MGGEEEKLINKPNLKHSHESTVGDVLKRWYILGLFFILTANQCLFWFTFSSNPQDVTDEYPRVSVPTIDQLLNWGPITFVPAVPFVSYLLVKDHGLQSTMRLAAVLSFSGCLIRMIPSFLSDHAREQWVSTIPLHVGQILNGIAGPVLIAAPSRLSAVWFPPIQRARVTAIANSSLFGAAIGFYLGQAVHITKLLWITLGMSAVPLVFVFCYCPAAPRVPPSRAVVLNQDQTPLQFLKSSAKILSSQPSMLLLMLVTGLGVGIYDSWIGVLPQILNSTGMNEYGGNNSSVKRQAWDSDLNGLCGMTHTFACIVGMWFSGSLADRVFRKKFKLLLILLFSTAAAIFLWLLCVLDGGIFSFASEVPRSDISVFAAVVLVGFVRTAAVPVLYEIAAEMTYPHPEGTSAGLIVFAEHLTLLSMLFAVPHMSLRTVSLLNLGGLALCPLVLLFIQPQYNRINAERKFKQDDNLERSLNH